MSITETSNDPNAFLMGGAGGKSAKFESIGDKVSGVITETPHVTQQTEYGTNKPKTWDNGDPMNQLVVTVKTELVDDPDDDGIRNFYLKGGAKREDTNQGAVARAVAAAGASGLAVGGTLSIAYIGDEPSRSGNPRKCYAAKYVPPTVNVANPFDEPTPAAAPLPDPFA